MVECVADAMGKRRQPEEMLPLLKRHEIQVLRRAGHSQSEVADSPACLSVMRDPARR